MNLEAIFDGSGGVILYTTDGPRYVYDYLEGKPAGEAAAEALAGADPFYHWDDNQADEIPQDVIDGFAEDSAYLHLSSEEIVELATTENEDLLDRYGHNYRDFVAALRRAHNGEK